MKKDKHFRYLEKYVGKYCVRAELDPDTNDFPKDSKGKMYESFEDLYIPCSKGFIKHTYEDDLLALYILEKPKTGEGVKRKFDEENIWYRDESFGIDTLLFFHESDLKKVAKIIKPKIRGKNISPFSKRALDNSIEDFEIPKEDLDRFKEITDKLDLEHMAKIQFIKKTLKDFDTVIQKKKGSRYDISKQRKESNLKPKEFIYSIGMWDEYLDFVQGEMNKR